MDEFIVELRNLIWENGLDWHEPETVEYYRNGAASAEWKSGNVSLCIDVTNGFIEYLLVNNYSSQTMADSGESPDDDKLLIMWNILYPHWKPL
jgi:hypothetical protein